MVFGKVGINHMSHFFELLVTLTVAGSTVVICMLLIRFISPQVFPAKWHYLIGKMAVWLYLFPIALIIKWLIPYLTPNPENSFLTALPIQQLSTGNVTSLISEQRIPFETAWLLFGLWGIGASTFAVWQVYCYHRFTIKVKESSLPISNNNEAAKQLAYLKKMLRIRGNVQLSYSSSIKSPVLVGLLKPTILLPMSDKLEIDLSMVLHHELVHLKRKDLWMKMLILVISALHWFNPLVHLLRKDIHAWSELSCDEEVVKEMTYAQRKRYGDTILNVMIGARGLPVRFCASLSGDGKQLKRRLTMMLNGKKVKKHTVLLMTATIIIIGAIGTSTAVWAAKSTPDVEGFVTHQFAIELKDENSAIDDETLHNWFFDALTPEQQKSVTKEMAHYYVDEHGNIDYGTGEIPFTSLTAEQQRQAKKELGWYSIKLVRELKDE